MSPMLALVAMELNLALKECTKRSEHFPALGCMWELFYGTPYPYICRLVPEGPLIWWLSRCIVWTVHNDLGFHKYCKEDVLILEMKRFIYEQIAASSDIELRSMYWKDVMGKDISDLPGLLVFQMWWFSPVWPKVRVGLGGGYNLGGFHPVWWMF